MEPIKKTELIWWKMAVLDLRITVHKVNGKIMGHSETKPYRDALKSRLVLNHPASVRKYGYYRFVRCVLNNHFLLVHFGILSQVIKIR